MTVLPATLIWMTSASAVWINAAELLLLPLLTVRVRPPVLSRMARLLLALLPVRMLVCWIVPLLVMVELPVTEIATLFQVTVKEPVEVTVPVSPAASVCLVVEALLMLNDAAEAVSTAISKQEENTMDGMIAPRYG